MIRFALALSAALPAILSATSLHAVEPAVGPRNPRELTILGQNYPRVFFFRASEGTVRYKSDFAAWDAGFSRLMGVMGKCLDEEVLGLDARNPDFFNRFKREHPRQAVLLHFNGNSRDPRYHAERYSPGHWIYRKAVRIVNDVPAQSGETLIRVESAADFQVGGGRYRTSNDDIGLFGVTPDGKHDWNYCEQVQLVSVDKKANAIVVKRGCYGTRPLAFAAGKTRAAAHAAEGPWGKHNNLLWFYNYTTHCPKNAQGRTCSDLLVEDLAAWFAPGGKLANFDGIEFDVLFGQTHGDTDGDGAFDHGLAAGVNQYGVGVIEFVRKLRARMGDNFIIQADGALGPGGSRSQRAAGLLNGIESEGWPNLNDWDFDDWSGGLNRHNFWQANAHPPAFSYINHKWVEPVPGKPGEHVAPSVPLARHRLVFAAAQFTDAMLCYSFPPARGGPAMLGIWDEFRRGADNQLGWLGRPEAPAAHLAAAAPNLLAAQPLPARIRGDVTVEERAGQLLITPRNSDAANLSFTLPDIAVSGSDLVLLATLCGQPLQGYPAAMPRFAEVEISGGKLSLMSKTPDEVGMAVRGKAESPLEDGAGARVNFHPRQNVGGRTLDAYLIHPPYRSGVGYVYWRRDLDVPPGAELRFSLGMGEKSPQRSDGLWFQVWAAELVDGRPGQPTKLFEKSSKAHEWIPCRVPLAQYTGKRVRLKFVADCGPRDNAVTDHGLWGDVKLVAADQDETVETPVKSYMTWVNDRALQSVFYFRGVKSPKVNLAFEVEGAAPITIERVSLHAYPDAMVRVFERGLVLANPSLSPYAFDLTAISPGRKYRRIQGTTGQDLDVNNGQPVRGKVRLDGHDGLFLMRD